jgi:hypothetical protein
MPFTRKPPPAGQSRRGFVLFAKLGGAEASAPRLRCDTGPSGVLAAGLRRAPVRREPGSVQPLSVPLGLHALQLLAADRSSPGTALWR